MNIPALGFGTAPILGRAGARESRKALEMAYYEGIRHFDTARSYGWGEAESLLGSFLKDKPRSSYTLVSKCGIVPVRRTRVLSFAKSIARKVLSAVPMVAPLVRRAASSSSFRPTSTYDVGQLEKSVETSLSELRVDYLDVLLLHNFSPERTGLPEVITYFDKLRERGKIRKFGFAVEGHLGDGLSCLHKHGVLDRCVVQAPASRAIWEVPGDLPEVDWIIHAPFRFLQACKPGLGRVDLAAFLAALGATHKCRAVVCSMFARGHIVTNARALEEAKKLSGPECAERLRRASIDAPR